MPPSNCCFPYFLIYIHFWMVSHFTWMCCPESSHRKIALLAGISTADELDWLTVSLAKLKPDGVFRSSPMGWFPSGHASFTLLYRCFCWYWLRFGLHKGLEYSKNLESGDPTRRSRIVRAKLLQNEWYELYKQGFRSSKISRSSVPNLSGGFWSFP